MALLQIKNLTCGYGTTEVVKKLSLYAGAGEFVALMGPNGSGKTTLIRAMISVIRPMEGLIDIEGRNIAGMEGQELARRIAYVPQISEPVEGFTVEEMVFMGRNPYLHLLAAPKEHDEESVNKALQETGLDGLRHREVSELSGGEYQRVLIARALAQGTEIILLDEPTAHLDIKHQVEAIKLLKGMKDKLVIAVMHDLNLARKHFSRVVLLKDGQVKADGEPHHVLDLHHVKEVFEVEE